MTVKELISELSCYPQDMDVMLFGSNENFTYGMLNTVKKINIRFADEDDNDLEAFVDCVVLDEE